MKYIDSEKLISEIERIQKFNHIMADHAINSNMRNFYNGEEEHKAMQALPIIHGWVARDNSGRVYGNLHFWFHKPTMPATTKSEWMTDRVNDSFTLPDNMFPELTWESEPVEVELIIKRV